MSLSAVTFPWSCNHLLCGCWNLQSLQTVPHGSSFLCCSALLFCGSMPCEKQMQENDPCNVSLGCPLEDFIPPGAVQVMQGRFQEITKYSFLKLHYLLCSSGHNKPVSMSSLGPNNCANPERFTIKMLVLFGSVTDFLFCVEMKILRKRLRA